MSETIHERHLQRSREFCLGFEMDIRGRRIPAPPVPGLVELLASEFEAVEGEVAEAHNAATAAAISEAVAARGRTASMESELGEALGTLGAPWDTMVRDVAALVNAADELDVVADALGDAERALEKAQDATAAAIREAEDLRLRARNAEECVRQALRENERLTSQRDAAHDDDPAVYYDGWRCPKCGCYLRDDDNTADHTIGAAVLAARAASTGGSNE